MSSWTTQHYKAITYWAKHQGWNMTLCSYPNAKFLDQDNNIKTVHIDELLKEFETNKKEEARERRRLKQSEENSRPWNERFKRD